MSPKKLTFFLRSFSLVKVPLLGLVRPQVVELSNERSVVRLPLNFLTKNHVGSMYFGALAMGAELSVALKIVDLNRIGPTQVSFIFKDFSCEFLRRADTDVEFCCDEAARVEQLFHKALATGERRSETFSGKAYSAGNPENEPFMTYRLTISVKAAQRRS